MKSSDSAGTYFTLFKNRDFSLIWSSQLISTLGNDFHFIALMWLVYQLTGSPLKMGLVLTFSYLPPVLFATLMGVYIDIWDRKKVMIFADLSRALFVFLLPLLYFLGVLQLWIIFLITFLVSGLTVIFEASFNSFIPNIVNKHEIIQANSLNQATFQITNIFGSALAGVLIATIGTLNLFFIDSVSYFFSAIFILIIRRSGAVSSIKKLREKFTFRVREALSFIYTNKVILTITLMMAFMNFALGPLNVLVPVFSEKVLNAGPEGFGFIMSSFSLGLLVGAFLVGKLAPKLKKGFLIYSGVILMGLSFVLFALSKNLALSIILICIVGFFFSAPKVLGISITQDYVPDNIRGRIFSVQLTMANIMFPISMFLSGALAQRVSVNLIFIIAGFIMILNGLFGMFTKSLRRV
ncbi:MAG: MFS transporter [Actinobacteria bacterium]|nr:MFS transporter [Actinomycetota bacterium]